jgi:ATP-dependent protease ClpP protease subunit
MNLEDLLKPSSNNVWDRYVPIISSKNHTEVFLTDQIDEPSQYNELCFKLKTASPAEVFTLHLNTPGGIIDSATMIIDAIKTSKAKVIANINGTVASAGTIITLACDEVIVADHTSFMIHNYSSGISGKGHEMKARQEFIDAQLNASFKIFYQGFLAEDEMEDVIDGKDMWMGKDEVVARLKGTFHKGLATETDSNAIEVSKKKRGRPAKKD